MPRRQIDWTAVAEEYRAGSSCQELAQKLGVSRNAVRNGLIRVGVSLDGRRGAARRVLRAIDQVETAYRAGATFRELGQAWGLSESGMRRVMLSAGIELENGELRSRQAARTYNERRRARIRSEFREGATVEELAVRFGQRSSYIRRVVGAPPMREEVQRRHEQVLALYRAGHTIVEAAAMTGLGQSQAGLIVRRAGLSRRRGPRPRPS